MLRHAALLGALTFLLAAPALASGSADQGVLRFLAPADNQVVAGETVFRFDVRSARPVERVDVYCGGQLLGSAKGPAWSLKVDVPIERSGAPCVAAAYTGRELLGRARLRTLPAGGTDRVQVTRVQLYPVVTDRSGKHVAGLAPADFTLFEDGREVAITEFSGRPGSLHVALLLDVSGSMGDKLALVQAAADEFVQQFGPDEPISVYAFNDTLRGVVNGSTDHAALTGAIDSLEAGGSTALFDALTRVIGHLAAVGGRKVIFVFSDGKDERSVNSLAQAIDSARHSDVVIYSVATVHEEDADRYRKDLFRLAESSGGQAYLVHQLGELRGVFEQVTSDLRAQYVLGFTPGPGPAGVRKLQLKARNADLKVRARTEYYHNPAS